MDPINPGFTATAARDPNRPLIGNFPVYTREVTIKSGQNLADGAVVGKDGDSKYLLSLSAASDGSQTPIGVLVGAVDASGGDKKGLVAFAGDFNEARLTFGTGHTAASTWLALSARGLYLVAPQLY
jgi:hypothetical protein